MTVEPALAQPVLDLEGYRSVMFWRGRVSKGTFRTYIANLGLFMRWLKVNGGHLAGLHPDGLIEYQKNTDNGTRYDILNLVQTWSQTLRTPEGVDYRLNSKKACYSALRSFFVHNRAPLPRDKYKLRSETPDAVGTLTIEEIRDVALSAKPMHRAVIISMFEAGLDLNGFQYWNLNGWEELEDALDGRPKTIEIYLPFRKLNRNPFYTFIGGDAIEAIRKYLPMRPTNAEREAIFYTQYKTPLSPVTLQQYWLERLEKLGLIVRQSGRGRRYGKNLHEMRDVFRSQWEKSPAKGSVAEFCMGHKIDPLGYNKACKDKAWTLGEYRKALPMLEIMSSGRPFGQVKEDEVRGLRDEIDDLKDEVERYKLAQANAKFSPEVIESMIEKVMDKRLEEGKRGINPP